MIGCVFKKELDNIYVFCKTKKIELIKNLMDLQLNIFCRKNETIESNTYDLLQQTRVIIDDLPSTISYKRWEIVLDYLCFEYYYSIGSSSAALQYFDKINSNFNNFLLYNHIGLVSRFLRTKIKFCFEFNKMELLENPIEIDKLLFDPMDIHSQISLKIYNSVVYFYQKKFKLSISLLSELQNEFVFKDYFHEFLNIKLTLLYFNIVNGEFEKAQAIIKMLSRRIKIENPEGYNHVLYLLKAFDLDINKDMTAKIIISKEICYYFVFSK